MGLPDWALQELEADDEPKTRGHLTPEEVLGTIGRSDRAPGAAPLPPEYRPAKPRMESTKGSTFRNQLPPEMPAATRIHYDKKGGRGDEDWAKARGQAEKEGYPIKRYSGMQGADKAMQTVLANAQRFTDNALDSATFGATGHMDNPDRDALEGADVPGLGVSGFAGTMAGYLAPGSVAGKGLGLIAKAAAPGARLASTVVGGAVGAGADAGVRDLVSRAFDAGAGREQRPLADSFFDVLGSSLAGGALGIPAHGVSKITGAAVDALRANPTIGPLLNNLEAAGGRTSANPFGPGVKPSPAMKEAQELQAQPLPSRQELRQASNLERGKSAQDISVNRAGESLHGSAKQLRETVPMEIHEGIKLPFMATEQGQHRVGAEPVEEAVRRYMGSKHLAQEGRPAMTHFEGGPPTELLKRLRTTMWDAGQGTPSPAVTGAAKRSKIYGDAMSGMPVQVPITYNAAELEREIAGWRYAIKNKRAQNLSHEFDDVVLEALRGLRSQFPSHPQHAPNGWAAEMSEAEQKMLDMEEALGYLGLDPQVEEINLNDPKQRERVINFVRSYRRPGSMNVDESGPLREMLAGDPVADEQLITAAGHRDYDALRGRTTPGQNNPAGAAMPNWLTSVLRWGGLHLDPAMQHISGKYRGGRTAPSGQLSQVGRSVQRGAGKVADRALPPEPAARAALLGSITAEQARELLREYRSRNE